MRNLFHFLVKYHFLLLFVVLELISLFLIANKSSRHALAFASSSNVISGFIYDKVNNISAFVDAKKENEQLLAENAQLRNKLKSSFIDKPERFKVAVDTARRTRYTYTPAEVIRNSVFGQNNFLTLNKGSNQGIEEDMVVVAPEGIVGIVATVSNNFASVISLLNSKLGVSGRLKNNNYFGSVVWNGTDYRYITLNEIPNHVKINKGDLVVTSGYSALFPKDFTIGRVVSKKKKAENNFFEIKVKLAANFKNLRYVYVIKNIKKQEQINLENKSKEY